jgi:hypothetical protein
VTVVRRAIDVPATVVEVEELWFDVRRWPAWIDGFDEVVELREPWPRAGGAVVWQSNPYGRGRVTEQATALHPGQGQSADVEDDRLSGRQAVTFAAAGGGTSVTLEFEYAIKRARPGMFVVDLLFIRRAVADSLRRTLEGFARELGSDV